MEKEPLVSVITPVYNGQQYIEECIASVLGQTYHNWEYLIADNMSSDATVSIAERFGASDPRIRVIRANEFVDIYTNHNRALEAMNRDSRYCKFVHSDDWLFPECIEKMVSVAESNPSVGVVSAFRLSDKEVQLDGLVPYTTPVVPGREVVRQAVLGTSSGWIVGSPTALLFRNDVVRARPRFYDAAVWHADTEAAIRTLLESDLGFVHQVLTFTRIHEDALSSFTYRVHTLLPFEGRVITRFGPQVLARDQFVATLHQWALRYGRWLAKQMLIPRRYGQPEFQRFHIDEIDGVLAETVLDSATRVALKSCRMLLELQRAAAQREPRTRRPDSSVQSQGAN